MEVFRSSPAETSNNPKNPSFQRTATGGAPGPQSSPSYSKILGGRGVKACLHASAGTTSILEVPRIQYSPPAAPSFADRLPFVNSTPRLVPRRNHGSRQWQKNKTKFSIAGLKRSATTAEPNAIAHVLEDPNGKEARGPEEFKKFHHSFAARFRIFTSASKK